MEQSQHSVTGGDRSRPPDQITGVKSNGAHDTGVPPVSNMSSDAINRSKKKAKAQESKIAVSGKGMPNWKKDSKSMKNRKGNSNSPMDAEDYEEEDEVTNIEEVVVAEAQSSKKNRTADADLTPNCTEMNSTGNNSTSTPTIITNGNTAMLSKNWEQPNSSEVGQGSENDITTAMNVMLNANPGLVVNNECINDFENSDDDIELVYEEKKLESTKKVDSDFIKGIGFALLQKDKNTTNTPLMKPVKSVSNIVKGSEEVNKEEEVIKNKQDSVQGKVGATIINRINGEPPIPGDGLSNTTARLHKEDTVMEENEGGIGEDGDKVKQTYAGFLNSRGYR